MKKLILLFTMVCAGQLYGMLEAPDPRYLPTDMKYEIMNAAVATSKDLKEAISMIPKLSAFYGVRYTDIKNFTKLLHALANRFNVTTEEVATQFVDETKKAPDGMAYLGKQYLSFLQSLSDAIYKNNVEQIKLLIQQGADVNSTNSNDRTTPLIEAANKRTGDKEILVAFLNAGANPNHRDAKGKTALDYAKERQRALKILQLLESVTKK